MSDLCPAAIAMEEQLEANPKLLLSMIEPGTVGELNLEVLHGALLVCRLWGAEWLPRRLTGGIHDRPTV